MTCAEDAHTLGHNQAIRNWQNSQCDVTPNTMHGHHESKTIQPQVG